MQEKKYNSYWLFLGIKILSTKLSASLLHRMLPTVCKEQSRIPVHVRPGPSGAMPALPKFIHHVLQIVEVRSPDRGSPNFSQAHLATVRK